MTVKPKDRTASDLIELAPQAPDDLYVAVEVCARCGAIVTTCRYTSSGTHGFQLRRNTRQRPAPPLELPRPESPASEPAPRAALTQCTDAEYAEHVALPADWWSAAAAARRPYPEEKPETEMTSPDEPHDLIDSPIDATEGIDALRTVDFDNEEEGR